MTGASPASGFRPSAAHPPAAPQPRHGSLSLARAGGMAAVIFLATLLAYLPALRAGFVWDDDAHVTKAGLQSLHGLGRIWGELGATQQYYPVLYSAFWAEHRLWGDAAFGYHLVNVLWHATAACLFGLALRRLAVGGAFFAALVFALHPVCVESVAWIAEQKNTLSTVFYLLSALVYLRWNDVRTPDEGKVGLGGRARPLAPSALGVSSNERSGATAQPYPRSAGLYLLALFLFLLAVFSKTVAATLPAALLVVAWWQRGRLSWKADVLPLLPWLGFGAGFGLFSAWVERTYIGAQGMIFDLSFIQRCLVAGRAIFFDLGELFWPVNIAFIYPHWVVSASVAWQSFFPLGALAGIGVLWLWRARSRGPLAVALFFVGSLFPTLGFFNVYAFAFSYVADHWQYLASLGVIAGVAGGLAAAPFFGRRVAWGRAGSVVLLLVLGALTWRQCGMYHDLETFYRTTLARNPAAWMPQSNLASLLVQDGRLDEAVRHYEEAIRLAPAYPEIHFNLADALVKMRRTPEAIKEYEEALRLSPDYAAAHANLGTALVATGRPAEAIPHFEQALRVKPDLADAHYGLGFAFEEMGLPAAAMVQYRDALRVDPTNIEAHYHLANGLANGGRMAEAIEQYEEALRLRPNYAEVHANLGLALAGEGRLPEALNHLARALQLKPDYAEAHADLGFALARAGRLPEAVREYRTALRGRPNDADVHYQLGHALRLLGETAAASAELETAERLSAPAVGVETTEKLSTPAVEVETAEKLWAPPVGVETAEKPSAPAVGR
jgi:tetratricopeptide (TPR) repeat protein